MISVFSHYEMIVKCLSGNHCEEHFDGFGDIAMQADDSVSSSASVMRYIKVGLQKINNILHITLVIEIIQIMSRLRLTFSPR